MAPELRELPTYTVGGFANRHQMASAIQQHEMGNFMLSADLCEVMSRDDRCAAVERTRIQGLLGLELDFESSTAAAGRGSVKDKLAREAKQHFWSMLAPAVAYQWVRWGLWMGIGIAQLIVDTKSVPGMWLPKAKVWHPRFCRWDWSKRCYVLTTEQGEVELREDDPEWALFLPYGYERGWMGGLVRNLAGAWNFRQWSYRDWGRWSEIHGVPIKVAIVPEVAEAEDKERFQREVTNIGNTSTVRTVDGGEGRKFDVQFREPMARSFDSFNLQVSTANTDIAVCVVGHNLTTEVKGGSLAAARVGDDVRTDIRQYDALVLQGAIRNGILKRWAKWNYGDQELAPWPKYNTAPAMDLKNAADGLMSLGTALQNLRTSGANPDVEEILEEFNVPTLGPLDDAELQERNKLMLPAVVQAPPGDPTTEQAGEPETGAGAGVKQAEA